ncbi:hypothetical protein [uncultured Rikenella sp.]|uniref:hypothetical protein n=1 Tax=uncultured Rikenella sp. TaxID=368003 RepID=UPI0025D850BF|nr:hypothetical protein [uncultured Rikenella sp.]
MIRQDILFRAAPGYRFHADGALLGIGNDGFCWSAATDDFNGLDLHFYSQYLYTCSANGHAYGFPLRCLSHPQGVLLASGLTQP